MIPRMSVAECESFWSLPHTAKRFRVRTLDKSRICRRPPERVCRNFCMRLYAGFLCVRKRARDANAAATTQPAMLWRRSKPAPILGPFFLVRTHISCGFIGRGQIIRGRRYRSLCKPIPGSLRLPQLPTLLITCSSLP